jgi:glycosyltransferase involved in cell wall biosynthesis
MRVLIVTSDRRVGGGQIAALRLARALARNYEVSLICACPEDADPDPPPVPKSVSELDAIPGHIRHYFPGPVWFLLTVLDLLLPPWRWSRESGILVRALNGWYQHIRRRHFRRVVRPEDYDIINSHVWQADYFVGECLPEGWKTPWVITMHGCYETLMAELPKHPEYEPRMRKVLNRADQLLPTALKNYRVLSEVGGIHLKRTPVQVFNGIEPLSTDDPGPYAVQREGHDLILALVSRAIPEKGWAQAIEAVRSINRETGARIKLILVGASPWQEQLKREHEEPSIEFAGHCPEPMRLVRQCDIGILPSYFVSESYPVSVMEYLMCGKPVIATDIGEVSNMIEHEGKLAGTLVPLGEDREVHASALTEAMKRYLNDSGLLQEQGRLASRAARKFSMDESLAAYESVFNSLRDTA